MQSLSKWATKRNKITENKQSKLEKVQQCKKYEKKQSILKWVVECNKITEMNHSKCENVKL